MNFQDLTPDCIGTCWCPPIRRIVDQRALHFAIERAYSGTPGAVTHRTALRRRTLPNQNSISTLIRIYDREKVEQICCMLNWTTGVRS